MVLNPKSKIQNPKWIALGAVAAAACLLAGCGQTERRITVTSTPEGALVYANGVEMGRTPVTFDYLWYGEYRFELRKEGYETLKTSRHVRASPNQWPIIDLITEVFVPVTLRDDKSFDFALDPLKPVDQDALFTRAEELRDRTIHAEK